MARLRYKVCIVSMIKAPLGETISFVNYHLNLGIDGIILFLDDPEDPAAQALSDYVRVRVIKCDDAYWTALRTEWPNAIQRRAIHIDGDELLMPDGDFQSILAQQSVDVVRFAIKRSCFRKDRYHSIFEATIQGTRHQGEPLQGGAGVFHGS